MRVVGVLTLLAISASFVACGPTWPVQTGAAPLTAPDAHAGACRDAAEEETIGHPPLSLWQWLSADPHQVVVIADSRTPASIEPPQNSARRLTSADTKCH